MLPASTHFSSIFMSSSIKEHRQGKNEIKMCYYHNKNPLLSHLTSVVSNSVRPHRHKPTRLPRPWDSPCKNTGVGCHFLLQGMKVKSESEARFALTDPKISTALSLSLSMSSLQTAPSGHSYLLLLYSTDIDEAAPALV